MARGRRFASKILAVENWLKASPPTPYTVSVGKTTMPPACSSFAAASRAASRSSARDRTLGTHPSPFDHAVAPGQIGRDAHVRVADHAEQLRDPLRLRVGQLDDQPPADRQPARRRLEKA